MLGSCSRGLGSWCLEGEVQMGAGSPSKREAGFSCRENYERRNRHGKATMRCYRDDPHALGQILARTDSCTWEGWVPPSPGHNRWQPSVLWRTGALRETCPSSCDPSPLGSLCAALFPSCTALGARYQKQNPDSLWAVSYAAEQEQRIIIHWM